MPTASRSPMQSPAIHRRGFSLVELLVVLTIVATLSALAVPSLMNIASSLQLRQAVDAMVQGLSLARSEAIKRNTRVVMCKSRAGKVCETTVGWEAGWLVFQDSNNDGQLNADEVVIYRQGALAKAVVFTTNTPVANYVSYTPVGATRYPSGGLQMGSFTACASLQSAKVAQEIAIGSVGRPRIDKGDITRCPGA